MRSVTHPGADGALLEEIVAAVCEFASDRASAVRRAVLDFVAKVTAGERATRACARCALEIAAFLASGGGGGDGGEKVPLKALQVAASVLGSARYGKLGEEDETLDEVSHSRFVALQRGGAAAFGLGGRDATDELKVAAVECGPHERAWHFHTPVLVTKKVTRNVPSLGLAVLLRDAAGDSRARRSQRQRRLVGPIPKVCVSVRHVCVSARLCVCAER